MSTEVMKELDAKAHEVARLRLEWRRCARYEGEWKTRRDVRPLVKLTRQFEHALDAYEEIQRRAQAEATG